ncbi:hypothetical protein EV649_5070 [Kribbella sp. VKM Ac-2569]|uniref:phage tail sheath family protein n=1 Tax=Kribbella sp. VKM Ac-2569 TaxID=2512220 RepID=UPI00102C7693|nr:phage tail sheath C-terminal domain-containing protein [Kribbella sp. VKM Ac-2569]RZT17523.1 hypothetical protein EV649_5070 [Kribbella sp. VKM Ac-2569]
MTLGTGLRTPGRPGVFLAPAPSAAPIQPERLDVAGFVGVALRGPVDEPVPVTRWSEFVQLFGGFERPRGGPERLLPHAVSAYFRQGGQLAYVLRVAPHGRTNDKPLAATATYRLRLPGTDADPLLAAANEGEWGNALQVRLRYEVAQQVRARIEEPGVLRLPVGTRISVGTLLRLHDPVLPAGSALRWVQEIDDHLARGSDVRVILDREVAFSADTVVGLDVVAAALDVADRSAQDRHGDRLTGLGLRPGHPRWLVTVLRSERHLVVPVGDWLNVDLTPTPALSPIDAAREADGEDRSHLVKFDAFFDSGDAGADPLDENLGEDLDPHVGVDRMGRIRDLGLLCVPDLTWRSDEAPPASPRVLRRPPDPRCCSACDQQKDEPEYESQAPLPLGLDARNPDDLTEIVDRQRRAVEVARYHKRFVALLDVPDGLSATQITAWRAGFDCSYAAAYHPWLAVAGGQGNAVAVPPSAFAAGIIAEREIRLGLPWGPANELALDAVRSEAAVTDAIHDRLHELGINVFRSERDGFRLTAGRTLSSDPDYRQLSVRRLMTMLRLSIEHQTQWLAFEPNNAELRERLSRVITGFLRTMNRSGAFAGATEAESFFVRCGDDVNPVSSLALGRLVAEIGVAPSSPLEYVMVRIARDVDGSLSVVSDDG